MTRSLALPVVALMIATGLVGCGSDKPPICSSMDDLKTSVEHLKDLNVSENGIAEIESQVSTIKDDLGQVKDDATAQYSAQVDTVEADFSTLTSSVTAAKETVDTATLGAVASGVTTLVSDVQSLAGDVATTC